MSKSQFLSMPRATLPKTQKSLQTEPWLTRADTLKSSVLKWSSPKNVMAKKEPELLTNNKCFLYFSNKNPSILEFSRFIIKFSVKIIKSLICKKGKNEWAKLWENSFRSFCNKSKFCFKGRYSEAHNLSTIRSLRDDTYHMDHIKLAI